MSLSFRTNGNFIDFVNTDSTSLNVETVLMSLHNTSRAISWSLPEDTTRISFTIDEVKYSNVLISEIDFDGTVMDSQDDFETGIEAMFTGYASPGGSSYLVYTALLNQPSALAALDDGNSGNGFQNTIGGGVVWSRVDAGNYNGTLAGAFTSGKTFIHPFGEGVDGIYVMLPIRDISSGNIVGYYTIFQIDDNTIGVYSTNTTSTATDLFTLFGGSGAGKIPIEIRVYP